MSLPASQQHALDAIDDGLQHGDPRLARTSDEHVEIGRLRDGAATLHRWLASYGN